MHRKYLGLAFLLAASGAKADSSLDSFFQDGKVSGNIRNYYFSRNYAGSATDLHAYSVGGKIKAESGSLDGFSAAAAGYFAHDIGFNNYSQNDKYLNPLLMGTTRGLDVIGEAYLQYQNPLILARAGNQWIDTPWINPSDGFMMPNLYQGFVTEISPLSDLRLDAIKITRFKNRTVSGFDDSNLFSLAYDNPRFNGGNNGSTALGAKYENRDVKAQAWLYNFQDFAEMAYLEGGYRASSLPLSPFVNFQYVNETGSGSQFLGSVDSRVYGAKVGFALPDKLGDVYFAYDKVPYDRQAGISNGNLLSPYTQVYNTDPLYTTVMNYGLVSARGAGHAWLLGATLKPMPDLDVVPTLSRYNTAPYVANVNAFMLDVAYHLFGRFKGLTLRDRLGIEHGLPAWGNTYVDNRVMLQYAF